jgi:hypothetical protein
VTDLGGSRVKLLAAGQREARRFDSGKGLARLGGRAGGAVGTLRDALAADYVALSGRMRARWTCCARDRRGGNDDAFAGGFRLWEEVVEPRDRRPTAWRVT